MRKYVGDYTLFMSGLFRRFVERGGYLDYYLEEGARSYRAVSVLDVSLYNPGFLMFEELSNGFEHYSGALDFMRKCYFAPRRPTKIRSQAFCGKYRAGCATDFPTTDGDRRESERLDRYLVRLGWAGSRRAAVELISMWPGSGQRSAFSQGRGNRARRSGRVIPTATHDALASNPGLKIEILIRGRGVIVANKPALMPCHPLRFDER